MENEERQNGRRKVEVIDGKPRKSLARKVERKYKLNNMPCSENLDLNAVPQRDTFNCSDDMTSPRYQQRVNDLLRTAQYWERKAELGDLDALERVERLNDAIQYVDERETDFRKQQKKVCNIRRKNLLGKVAGIALTISGVAGMFAGPIVGSCFYDKAEKEIHPKVRQYFLCEENLNGKNRPFNQPITPVEVLSNLSYYQGLAEKKDRLWNDSSFQDGWREYHHQRTMGDYSLLALPISLCATFAGICVEDHFSRGRRK